MVAAALVAPGCASSSSQGEGSVEAADTTAAPPAPAGTSNAAVENAAVVTRGDFVRDLQLTGELEATRSIAVKSPETSLWQLRITYMADEGAFVEKGQPILDFDNSSLAAQHRELETRSSTLARRSWPREPSWRAR